MMVNKYSVGYQSGFPWVQNLHPCVGGVIFNTLKPPFDNPDVRWALTLAIDIVSYRHRLRRRSHHERHAHPWCRCT